MLDTISGDRIRYELECIFHEERPEKVLHRAEELGVLQKLHPVLKGNGWLMEKFEQARQLISPNPPPLGLYLALLAYYLTSKENEYLISYLRLSKTIAQTLRDSMNIKTKLKSLADPELMPSRVYSLLHGYALTAINTNSLASSYPVARHHIQLFLSKLRYIKPTLTGDDLQRMGIIPGPRIKEILNQLHEARLDGKVRSKKGEVELVKGWLD
jgi:tRNA nucleotidyltransferase (CCA-adding enzyme)